MCTQKMRALSYIGAEKITFPPKSDILFRKVLYISAFCGRTGRPTDKIFFGIEAHLWGESAQKEIGAISQLGAEKITFSPKSDGLMDGHK